MSRLIATGVVMMYYLYLSVTKRALDVFNCNPTDPPDGNLYTPFTSLECDGGGHCRCNAVNSDGTPGLQLRLQPLAIAFIIFYTIGFPAFIFIIWYKDRRNMMLDQYFRACGFGDERATNPHYDLRKRYSKLYYHFKPQYTFWILLILARKMGIAFAALFLRYSGTFQLSVIIMILFASFVAQVLYRPYMSTSERKAVLEDLYNKADRAEVETDLKPYVEIAREVRAAEKDYSTEKRKDKVKEFGSTAIGLWGNRMSTAFRKGDGENPKKKEEKKLFFFDFNSVEMVLLGSAIMLSLAGLMFASGRFEGRKDLVAQRDAITVIALLILIFSLIYYFFVFLSEFSPYAIGYCVQRFCMSRVLKEEERIRTNSLQTQENPMFSQSGPKFADTTELEGKLGMTTAELERAETENKRLREQLRIAKQKEQELAVAQNVGTVLPVAKPTNRKQFGQQRE